MGVKRVHVWRASNINAEMKQIQDSIESMGARQTGKWQVQCIQMRPKQQLQQLPLFQGTDIYVVQLPDAPDHCFLMANNIVTQAKANMQLLLQKIDSFERRFTITLDGREFKFGDFVIRLGSFVKGSNIRGVVFEAEYAPCLLPQACSSLLAELMSNLLSEQQQQQIQQQLPPPQQEDSLAAFDFAPFGLPAEYTHMHTVCQLVSRLRAFE